MCCVYLFVVVVVVVVFANKKCVSSQFMKLVSVYTKITTLFVTMNLFKIFCHN